MVDDIIKWMQKKHGSDLPLEIGKGPYIIPRQEHNISRDNISQNALKVLTKLHKHGYRAYLVGGSVRDLLMGNNPKDFDIATDALPEEVAEIFQNCRLIGRRFRLAHVFFARDIIEVATFRSSSEDSEKSQSREGMILRDNVYGTMEEDVFRRDFTINTLYYNIADFSVVDFVGGIIDIKNKQLRLIGSPEVRFREDPVRMLRAVRFASKLGFKIEDETKKPIYQLRELLKNISPARLFEEYQKMFLSNFAYDVYNKLQEFGLFEILFPLTYKVLLKEDKSNFDSLLEYSLKNTVKRINEGKTVAPGFLLAVFLWQPMIDEYNKLLSIGLDKVVAFNEAIESTLKKQQKATAAPRRVSQFIRDMWILQDRLIKRKSRLHQLHGHPRFRAAYDFLLLRAENSEWGTKDAAKWWTKYNDLDESKRRKMISQYFKDKKQDKGKK